MYRGFVANEEASPILNVLLRYPMTLYFDESLLKRGFELATEYNRPTAYDSQYLALAERLSCDYWTADERLFNAVNGKFPHVHYLGDWRAKRQP